VAYDEAKAKLIAFDTARNQELKRLQEENAALRAQLSAQVKETADSLHDDAVKLKEAAVQPADADAVDAKRYRWLKERQAYVAVHPHYKDLPLHQRTGWTIRLVNGDSDSFDAAIDAAIAAQSTEGAKG